MADAEFAKCRLHSGETGKPGAVAISGRVLASLNLSSTRGTRYTFFRWKKKFLNGGFKPETNCQCEGKNFNFSIDSQIR